jgi:HEPN domain-containing protein/predicted nucleotidyltransferase
MPMPAFAPLKTSLDHLPDQQQQELAKVVEIICAATHDVLAVLLYGSYARGDWVDGPHEQGRGKLVGHKTSDYDILVVTSSEYTATDHDLWSKVRTQLMGVSRASINPIARDLSFINDKLSEGQYFFTEVIHDAILLYSKGEIEFENPKPLDAKRELDIAEFIMKETFGEYAKGFYENFEFSFERKKYKNAAFLLHQACEPAFKTITHVFGGEYPQEHYLHKLSPMAQQYCPALKGILFEDSEVPEEIFGLLNYAYIGARYDRNYNITPEQLQILAPRVIYLHQVIEVVCQTKIDQLKMMIDQPIS